MTTEVSTAEELDAHVPGQLRASNRGRPWKDLLIQIFTRNEVQESLIIPAVPEPLIVWVLSGAARVEERELGGTWMGNDVTAGDFFLTNSPRPCELRWKTRGTDPFVVMHVYLSLPLMQRSLREQFGDDIPPLRETSGGHDEAMSAILELLRAELVARHAHSALYVQGLAQALASHLCRSYTDVGAKKVLHRGGLPAFKLHRVLTRMEETLASPFGLARLAQEAGLSESHFCRAFKTSTGLSPSQYFIRLRMENARRQLRESERSVIDIALEYGYSSPSHFSQLFRREIGVSPTEYRNQL